MSDKNTKGNANEQGAAGSGNLLNHAFHTGISAAEEIHRTAFDIPLKMLEGMGAPQDKIDMLRDKSQSMIGELYQAITTVAAQVGPVTEREADKNNDT